MKLNNTGLLNRSVWERAGIKLPGFNREAMIRETLEAPIWIHFGAGNIFRIFPAMAQQELLEKGLSSKGIIAAFTMEPEVIEALWKPCDNLSLTVTLKTDGTTDMAVMASVAAALYCDESAPQDYAALKKAFENPSLQMVSFTITEKGYANLLPGGAMDKLAGLLLARYKQGAYPLALVSMDNCSKNGQVLHDAVIETAKRHGDSDFINYINAKLSFPWTMIDKITPGPDKGMAQKLREMGFENAETIITKTGTFASTFVNAEEVQYLIIEDDFPNGRPRLEEAGIIFTNRNTVSLSEKMKVCSLLNPLHTALGTLGCLLGIDTIANEMRDDDLRKMAEILGYKEGLPAAADPGIINPVDFLREVLEKRLPNPFLPDSPFRITIDHSQKVPIRFGETVKTFLSRDDLDVSNLEMIPLAIASWCRYLMGVDDAGNAFEPSPDPLLDEMRAYFNGVKLGEPCDVHAVLEPFLRRIDIFAVDLCDAGLSGKVEGYFESMITGNGAVRKTLHNAVSNYEQRGDRQ